MRALQETDNLFESITRILCAILSLLTCLRAEKSHITFWQVPLLFGIIGNWLLCCLGRIVIWWFFVTTMNPFDSGRTLRVTHDVSEARECNIISSVFSAHAKLNRVATRDWFVLVMQNDWSRFLFRQFHRSRTSKLEVSVGRELISYFCGFSKEPIKSCWRIAWTNSYILRHALKHHPMIFVAFSAKVRDVSITIESSRVKEWPSVMFLF